LNILNLIIEVIQIISESKLIKGGVAILLIIDISQKKEIKGEDPKNPLLKIILRENLRIYNRFPPKNIEEDLNPCAIININLPIILIIEKYKILLITRPICATEEYAITTFISNCLMQINPIIADPDKEIEIIKDKKELEKIKGENRINP
jgi:hypothetical protein